MKDFSKEIKAYALRNAIEYGKTDAGNVLSKLFQHGLDKKDIKNVMPEIVKIVNEISKLSKVEQKKEFEKYKNLVVVHEEKEKGLPEIDVSGLNNVVTRLAPEPSKYNHLGHGLSFLLNYLYSKKYNGRCLLRFEDTNPEKVSQEYVDAMKEDVLDYLDIKLDGIRYVSDDMDMLYKNAEKLIKMGKAYMCFCEREKMQDFRHKGIECGCRGKNTDKNIEEWTLFLKGKYKDGEAVLRIKGDMKSQNHVMRDSVIFRSLDFKHYRTGTKYKVWPMYDFYNPIEDSIMGVTLILRSNEFDMRVELQEYIKDLLELKKQQIVQYGRFNVVDFTTKGREIRELVDSGKLIGWDDPRLITLRALKRRGIQKEAIYELVKEIGLKKSQVNLEFNMIAAINRKLIDPIANRYSFVENPIELKIKGNPEIKEVEVQIHPNKKETRKIKIGEKLFISKKDFEQLKGKEVRLIHLYNFELGERVVKSVVNGIWTSSDNKPIQKINWVSSGVSVKILMDNGKWIEGIAESAVQDLKEGEMIQFERFGFCRLDRKNKGNLEFWFAHK
ncbi:MAG: glutamate--tRNA ligase [Nanoarchaeota archaeon]